MAYYQCDCVSPFFENSTHFNSSCSCIFIPVDDNNNDNNAIVGSVIAVLLFFIIVFCCCYGASLCCCPQIACYPCDTIHDLWQKRRQVTCSNV